MTLFMFYMTGTGLSIWTIMITIAMVTTPITSLFKVNTGNYLFSMTRLAFAPFEHKQVNLLLPKLTYMFFNAVILAAALYKFSSKNVIHQFL